MRIPFKIKMAIEDIKCSTSYVIRKFQIIKTKRSQYTSVRMDKTQNTDNSASEDIGQQKLSFIPGGNARWYSHLEDSSAASNISKHTITIRFGNFILWYFQKSENIYPRKYLL